MCVYTIRLRQHLYIYTRTHTHAFIHIDMHDVYKLIVSQTSMLKHTIAFLVLLLSRRFSVLNFVCLRAFIALRLYILIRACIRFIYVDDSDNSNNKNNRDDGDNNNNNNRHSEHSE